jgi:hypothetical protein
MDEIFASSLAYSFKANTNDNWERFTVHFQETATGIHTVEMALILLRFYLTHFQKKQFSDSSLAEKGRMICNL